MDRFDSLEQMIETLPIPNWARWLAMDEDGSLWSYEAEPHCHDHGWYENEVGRCQRLTRLQLDKQGFIKEKCPAIQQGQWRQCLWKLPLTAK